MQENETAPEAAAGATEESGGEVATAAAAEGEDTAAAAAAAPAQTEEISYHAVEKDGQVTAIWEMQGRKHVRTIDPRSRQGQDILRLYTADQQDETAQETEPAA